MFLIQEVNPTLLVCVPRVLEKFKEAVSSQLDDVKGIKKVILTRSQVRQCWYIGVTDSF